MCLVFFDSLYTSKYTDIKRTYDMQFTWIFFLLEKSDIFNFHLEFLGREATHFKINHRFMEHHPTALIGGSTNYEGAKQVGHIPKSMHFWCHFVKNRIIIEYLCIIRDHSEAFQNMPLKALYYLK